jgi:hypothetical protein
MQMVKLPGPIEKVEGESGPSDAQTINVALHGMVPLAQI